MGFLKDFKDDFSQAVNELMPGEENAEKGIPTDDVVVNTLEEDMDVASELSKIDDLLEKVAGQVAAQSEKADVRKTEEKKDIKKDIKKEVKPETKPEIKPEMKIDEKVKKESKIQEEKKMVEHTTPVKRENAPVSDEVSIITNGMIIKGDIITNGSLDIQGEVYGNVECNGKLVVTGTVKGNSTAAEIFADAARIEGEVASNGTIKIGIGSVIIGNVSSTSAVIAGAIKGDIDVQGPVVVDTSAVVKGNIKSRSVQINNGAVIDGFCSQTYADVDMDKLFGSKEGK